jgi:predicted transcriptional regulator
MKVWCKNMQTTELDLTSLTADIVSAYVAHNALTGDKLPDLIGSVYGALTRASLQAIEPEKVELKPAVAVKKSVTPEHLICLEDGKKFKSLKRHLKTHYDMSPEEYREKWGLPHDYPMVAPNYAAARSNMAKNMGLGRRSAAVAGTQPEVPGKAEPAEKPKRGKQTRKASMGSRK